MAGIFSSLSSTARSLQTHSLNVQQAGKNIANINNKGYARQRVDVGTTGTVQTPAGPTTGPLVATGMSHIRDVFIDRQILGETAYHSSLEAKDFRLKQALANFGDTIDRAGDAQFIDDVVQSGGGLRGAIDYFFNSFEALSARPNDATTRQVAFQSAENMVDMFHSMDESFDLLQNELQNQIKEETGQLNDLLGELEEINVEIARLETGRPGSALDMRDLRQKKLEEISEYALIEASEVPGSNGQLQITLSTADGGREVIVGPSVSGQQIHFNESDSTFRIPGLAEAVDLQAGRLPAVLDVHDNTVADLRGQIDTVAHELATEVNELYYQAYVPAGVDPAIPEIAFFQEPTPPPSESGSGTVTAATISLYSEPSDPSITDHVALSPATLRTTETGLKGANELALAMAELGSAGQTGLGGITYSEFSSRLVTGLGQDIRNGQNRLEVQAGVKELLENRRLEVSGVSMDEEVSNMLQYQKAYQATSRYFNVLSEMLDTLIEGLGR